MGLMRSWAAAALISITLIPGAAQAVTPANTLVIAKNIDDIISLDPGEAYEASGGEIITNVYDRLVRFEATDVKTLVGGVAESWTVSPDGRTFSFTLRPGLTFQSGDPVTGRGRGLFAATRRAARQDTELPPDAVRLDEGQCGAKHQGDRSFAPGPDAAGRFCAEPRAQCHFLHDRRRRRQEGRDGTCGGSRSRQRLAQEPLGRFRRFHPAVLDAERIRRPRRQSQVSPGGSQAEPRRGAACAGSRRPAAASRKGRRRHRPQSDGRPTGRPQGGRYDAADARLRRQFLCGPQPG